MNFVVAAAACGLLFAAFALAGRSGRLGGCGACHEADAGDGCNACPMHQDADAPADRTEQTHA